MKSIHPRSFQQLLPLVVPLMALAAALIAIQNAGYLMHPDTSSPNLNAVELLNGCWNYMSQPTATFMLAALYALFGVNPEYEAVLLAALVGATLYLVYWLTHRIADSQWAGVLGSAWLLSLPAFLYFSRVHIAYPLFWFTVALALGEREKHLWSGVCLGMTVLAHSSLVPAVGLWLVLSAGVSLLRRKWGPIIQLAIGALLVYAAYELLVYLFLGLPFDYARATLAEISKVSTPQLDSHWYTPFLLLQRGNAWWQTIPLVLSLVPPSSLLRPRQFQTLNTRLWMLHIGLLVFFAYFVGVQNGSLKPQWVIQLYIPATILASQTINRVTQNVFKYRQPIAAGIGALAALSLGWGLIRGHEFSRSANDKVIETFEYAAEHHQPIRFWMTDYHGLFFARAYGVEAGITDPDPAMAMRDTQAILLFELADDAGPFAAVHDALSSRRALYDIATMPDLIDYATGKETTLEIWTPRSRSGNFAANNDWPAYVYYYSGKGCFVQPAYGYGTEHWYQLLIRKAREVLFGLVEESK